MGRLLIRILLRLLYRVELHGSVESSPRLLILSNHQSFLDPIVLGAFLPVRPVWVVHTTIAKKWFIRIGLRFVPHLTLDTNKSMAMKTIVGLVESGRPVLIFPEGRITNTGRMMKIYEGPAFVAAKTGATVVPIHIDGAVYSPFSRTNGDFPRRLFPRITVTVRPPCVMGMPDAPTAKARRRIATERLRKLMQETEFASRRRTTLFPALLDAIALHGRGRRMLEDVREVEDSYGRILTAALALGRIVAKLSREGETVGVLLPNLSVTVSLLFGMFAMRRVPAILNFTSGAEAMQGACRAAGVTTVVTSRAFLEKARLEATARKIGGVRLVYLEDLRPQFGLADKIWLMGWARWFPRRVARPARPEDTAVVLFTSGSEGKPKGVALSHGSILANIAQIHAVIECYPKDRFLSALPLFHAFGLSIGAILPLLNGSKIFLHPTPLHYRVIPERIYDRDCTVLFATNTFLANYGKFANPYDFRTLRLVMGGAEKLTEEVRRLYAEKFGVRVLEGYGATECSPVIAVNTLMANRAGTVGELLPGMEYRVAPVAGIEEGGMLHLKGPNLMLGYLREDRPGVVRGPASQFGDGWYETGDIVSVDGMGVVTILGRMRRFAKVAGEMVSLEVVERIAGTASPAFEHASAAVPQGARGEMIVLLTLDPNLRREHLQHAARSLGAPEMALPRRIVTVRELPVLGNGKRDYVAVEKLALEAAPAPAGSAK